MMDIGNNMGRNRTCVCEEKETTEHIIIECEKINLCGKRDKAKE